MNSFLLFLIKSTLSLSLLYLAFSVLMRKETFFKLNRMVLLVMVFSSMLIPFLYVPKPVQPGIQVNLEPIFQVGPIVEEPVSSTEIPVAFQSNAPAFETKQPVAIPVKTIVIFVYLSGVLVSFLMFVYSIGSVLLLFRKARKTELNGIRIRIVDQDIPAFSFGRNILISQHDFDTNPEAIITHEHSHIKLGHFYDLMLMELVKIIFWFNPLVYRMVSDLKEIHEFQADDHTLHSGIDATQYQLLIIQKCVGHQKFALANSFNHCQIKNRITMMNKQKTSKAWSWKVATFLPLLALLLMAFGKTGGNAPMESHSKMAFLNQEKTSVKEATTQPQEKIYTIVEVMPEFPGGDKALRKFLSDELQYPKEAEAKGIQGKVIVSFILNSEGKIVDPKVTRSIDPSLDAEALRLIRLMHNWTPAKQKGIPVSVSFSIPINFVLTPESSNKPIIAPPPPPPNKDKHQIWLRNDGKVRYNLSETPINENELAEKVKSELQKNPKLRFDVMIEEGKIDERVDQIKEILKANGNPKVSFFSFHEEKRGKDSKGIYSSVLYSKPMDIK